MKKYIEFLKSSKQSTFYNKSRKNRYDVEITDNIEILKLSIRMDERVIQKDSYKWFCYDKFFEFVGIREEVNFEKGALKRIETKQSKIIKREIMVEIDREIKKTKWMYNELEDGMKLQTRMHLYNNGNFVEIIFEDRNSGMTILKSVIPGEDFLKSLSNHSIKTEIEIFNIREFLKMEMVLNGEDF